MSNLNVVPGATVPNLASVVSGMSNSLALTVGAGSVHLIVDLAGYFAPAPATCTTGCVYAWGRSDDGMLGAGGGTGDNAYYGEPTPGLVSGLAGVTAIAHRYALRSDGTVWAWGTNTHGDLGAGWHAVGSFAPVPVRVRGLTGVTAIAGMRSTGYALRSDGTVWGWGMNYVGELGTGAPPLLSDVPVQIVGVDDVVAIAASSGTGYAVRSDGTVWAWGNNVYGDLGIGTIGGGSATPVQVVGLTDVTAIAAAEDSRYTLRSDGTVWTWGGNAEGQLGNGTWGGMSGTAAPVPGLGDVVSAAGSGRTGYALLADRTVMAWGANMYGQAGVEGFYVVTEPMPVQGLSGVTSVVGMNGNGFALLADGSVWGWGVNLWYALGFVGGVSHSVPHRIAGLPPATAIAATGYNGYAMAG